MKDIPLEEGKEVVWHTRKNEKECENCWLKKNAECESYGWGFICGPYWGL